MIRIIYVILLLSVFIQACNTRQSSECDIMDENGWIGIAKAPQPCGYYLVEGKIFAFEVEMPDTVGINALIKRHAMSNAYPISGADPKSFRVCINNDRERYAKDRRNVYYAGDGEYIDGLDFNIIDNTNTVRVIDANPQTFRYIGCGYATDGSNVYYKGINIAGADSHTFKLIGDGYAFDSNYAYDGECKIVDANPQTFNYSLRGDSIDEDDLNLWYSKIKWADACDTKGLVQQE